MFPIFISSITFSSIVYLLFCFVFSICLEFCFNFTDISYTHSLVQHHINFFFNRLNICKYTKTILIHQTSPNPFSLSAYLRFTSLFVISRTFSLPARHSPFNRLYISTSISSPFLLFIFFPAFHHASPQLLLYHPVFIGGIRTVTRRSPALGIFMAGGAAENVLPGRSCALRIDNSFLRRWFRISG